MVTIAPDTVLKTLVSIISRNMIISDSEIDV